MIQLKDAVAAAKAFTAASLGKTAPPEEIKLRVEICIACKSKSMVRTLLSQSGASKVLGMMANRNKVPGKIRNYRCDICRCSLMLLVPALRENLHEDSPAQAAERAREAPACWLLTP